MFVVIIVIMVVFVVCVFLLSFVIGLFLLFMNIENFKKSVIDMLYNMNIVFIYS